MARQICVSCKERFSLAELHIDPNTSEWYCDPCYNVMMLERCSTDDSPEESYDDED